METTDRLESFMISKGWRWYQDSPTDGKWFKFDSDGRGIAKEGDETWLEDIKELF